MGIYSKSDSNGRLRHMDGVFNQFAQHLRITRSRHTGAFIVEELNPIYGYWATIRGGPAAYALPDEVVRFLLALPPYLGPLHEKDEEQRNSALCG